MYRDFFTNKWVIGGVVFLIVFSVACVLWYRYDTAAARKEAAETADLLRQWAAKKAGTNGKTADASADSPTPTAEKSVTETITELVKDTDTDISTIEGAVSTLPGEIVSQDHLVSPYGFGPYPELPEGFGAITWPRKDAESELMIRVRIKLLNQGIPVEGIVMSSNGLVYPIIKGIRYVTWGETSDGRRYLRRSRGHPDDGDYLRAIANKKEARGETLTQADVPHIQLIPMEEGGIDPYVILDLPK